MDIRVMKYLIMLQQVVTSNEISFTNKETAYYMPYFFIYLLPLL